MAQFKITAVEGLRTQPQDEVDRVWGDFYTHQHEQQQKELEEEKAETKTENETAYEEDFEVDEEEEKDRSENGSYVMDTQFESSSQHTSTEKLDEPDSQPEKKHRKKSKGKKLKTGSHSKPPPLNLYQDEMKHHLGYSRERSSSINQDTMSDQEVGRRRGRKLHRRGQMKKCHSLENAVEQAGRDRLEQKFVELEDLMSRPLMDKRALRVVPEQQKQRLSNGQHHIADKRRKEQRGNNFRRSMGGWIENSNVHEEETTDRQAYSTIHKLQTTGPPQHVQTAHSDQHSDQQPVNNQLPPRNSRLASKPPLPRRRRDSVDSSSTPSPRRDDNADSGPRHNGFDHFSSDDDGGSKDFGDASPRSVYLPADMHIKYSNNPKLQEWLKRKNTEHRQSRKAERAKKKEERNAKLVEMEAKAALREKSSERVKQWMDMKQKEAAKQQREERRKRKREAQEQATLRARSAESTVTGKHIDRPQSAPSNNKTHTPIRRPESAARLENGAYSAPKPPDSKFVYKRPVSGRVRLMKIQNEKNAKARNGGEKRDEDLSPEEKEKKMRVSYDAWLITKRKEDVNKRKEAKRQKDLIKSDPEMEHLIPELAARRIDRIKNGKKSIDTGMSIIDDDVNNRFGGGRFGELQDKLKTDDEDSADLNIPKPSSYKLAVEGSAATLVELNTRARPTSAKTRMPIPQSALSPRRPQSAKPSRDSSPKVRSIMDADHTMEPNPYKLPFSDDLGVPHHVRRVQERIFSKQAASQSNNSERPEPQGCASESAVCPKDVDAANQKACPKGVDASPRSDATPRSSLVLLQQIEAAAVRSEQEAMQAAQTVASSDALQMAAVASESQPRTKSQQEPPEQHTTDSMNPAEVLNSKVTDGGDMDTDDEEFNEGDDESGEELEESEEDKEEETSDHGRDNIALQQEADSHRETLEADSNADMLGTATHHDEDRSDQQPKKKNPSEAKKPEGATDDSSVTAAAAEEEGNVDAQQKAQDLETEESLRRSMKHVSFSEDLATVFEPTSAETSSNFDDERGADEPEESMSLDDAPDPV